MSISKNSIKNILKLLVTVGGLYLAYRQIDFGVFNTNWREYNIWLFVLATVMSIASVGLTSSRLYIVLKRKVPFTLINRSDFMASFFNIFLPSTIGGDVVKISKVSKFSGSFRNSTVSVIVDRFFGVISLVVLSAVFSITGIVGGSINLPSYVVYIMGAILVITILGIFFLLKVDLSKFKEKTIDIKISSFEKTLNIGKWIDAVYGIREIPAKDFLLILLLSFIYSLNSSIIAFLCLRFLGVNDISLSYVILFRSISAVLLMLPISISGIGVRDYIFKELYGSVTSSQQVLLLAPVTFLILCILAAVGGVIFLFDKRTVKNT